MIIQVPNITVAENVLKNLLPYIYDVKIGVLCVVFRDSKRLAESLIPTCSSRLNDVDRIRLKNDVNNWVCHFMVSGDGNKARGARFDVLVVVTDRIPEDVLENILGGTAAIKAKTHYSFVA